MPPSDLHRIQGLSVVRQRLQSVEDALIRFRKSPTDHEALHDMRVACRRAESALRLCRDLLPSQPGQWLRKKLRQLRRSSNASRDLEVMRKWLKGQGGTWARDVQKAWKSERHRERCQMVEEARDLLRGDRWAEHAKRACAVDDDRSPDRDRLLIAHRFLDELIQFVEALPTVTTTPSELHQFRIASKRLRYAIECVCEIVPQARFGSLTRMLTQIQERLGELHDLDLRLECLKHWAETWDVSTSMNESTAQSQRLLKSWQKWWRSITWQTAVGTAVNEILRLR